MNIQEISRDDIQARIAQQRPLVLLEALNEHHYGRGHLPGALNLPHEQVRALAPIVVPDKAAELVVYCTDRACQNSKIAATALVSMGYRNVSVFPGGKQEWTDAGLPLET
jgi:rhodanese-related sulfurtransferase